MTSAARYPQINIRIPGVTREALKSIATQQDRSVNYIAVKAIEEFIARNSEAPTTCNSQGL
ncbi:Arc family DNA-binding protein [Yersinia enterocolitica]|nr:Arc family DNA-binding protein [Yersinia enterocolitica]EKN6343668.1 Arc family DNA-binding protein [Yersinia enterocolitica]